MEIILGIIWLMSGVAGFVFWWTLKNDLTADLNIVITALLAGLLGPFSFVLGSIIYAPTTNRVIINRRIRR